MILASLIALIVLISLIIGYFVGFYHAKVENILKKLQKPIEHAETGPTPGLYHEVNEFKAINNNKNVGPVLPKEPGLLEWEEQERIREANNRSF